MHTNLAQLGITISSHECYIYVCINIGIWVKVAVAVVVVITVAFAICAYICIVCSAGSIFFSFFFDSLSCMFAYNLPVFFVVVVVVLIVATYILLPVPFAAVCVVKNEFAFVCECCVHDWLCTILCEMREYLYGLFVSAAGRKCGDDRGEEKKKHKQTELEFMALSGTQLTTE